MAHLEEGLRGLSLTSSGEQRHFHQGRQPETFVSSTPQGVFPNLPQKRHPISTQQQQDQLPRTYINVTPRAVAGRNGQIFVGKSAVLPVPSSSNSAEQLLLNRSSSSSSSPSTSSAQQPRERVPAIPQSQEVKKFIKEPSYSTILLPQADTRRISEAELPQQLQQQQQQQPLQQQQQPLYVNFEEHDEGAALSHYSYYPSPPSPVSSSYSELRQATKVPPGYYLQQMLQQQQQQQQQQGVTYDSLYEPIQQPQVHLVSVPLSAAQGAAAASQGSEIYYFGQCTKCAQRIVGEGSGCEAMGRRYHVHCFTCHHCGCQLQGKPFYALDGKPYCSDDYLNTLEKCCKCLSPILDRILRATGKPYHPACFTCLVCERSLDWVPFTVDATNRIHCIPCFHQRFAPKCSVCKKPIMPEGGQEETVRVVALDRSFHVDCYRCEDCNVRLSSDEEMGCYPLDEHVLCKNCNTKRIQALTSAY